MSHSQFGPMYLLATNGSQQYFVPQTIPALGQVNADDVIQSQYPVASAPVPQQHSLFFHSLSPTSFTQPYSTYQANHTPEDDSNDVPLPCDSTLSDGVIYPDMSRVHFSPSQTPQLPEQLEQPPYLQALAKRRSAVRIVNPETLQEVNVDDDADSNDENRAVAILNPETLQEVVNVDDDAAPNDKQRAVAILNPETLQEVNVDDADPNDEHSVQSKETVDNTWMVVEDVAVALNNLKEDFETFRNQMTKDIEELRNQNREFQNRVTKDVEELRDQVTKNQEELSVLKSLISVTKVSKLMMSKFTEIDSYEKFCVIAREAEMPCEPEDYEEFKYNKERANEINSRLHRKLLYL